MSRPPPLCGPFQLFNSTGVGSPCLWPFGLRRALLLCRGLGSACFIRAQTGRRGGGGGAQRGAWGTFNFSCDEAFQNAVWLVVVVVVVFEEEEEEEDRLIWFRFPYSISGIIQRINRGDFRQEGLMMAPTGLDP